MSLAEKLQLKNEALKLSDIAAEAGYWASREDLDDADTIDDEAETPSSVIERFKEVIENQNTSALKDTIWENWTMTDCDDFLDEFEKAKEKLKSEKSRVASILVDRPKDEDFDRKIKGYLESRKYAEWQYEQIKWELEDFSRGRGDVMVRTEFYPGWLNEDFKELLRRLKEKESS